MSRVSEGNYDDLAVFSEEFQEFLKFVILKREGKVIPSEKDNIPSVDVFSSKDKIVIEVELAGMDQDDIEITYINPFIFIRGTKVNEPKETKVNYVCMECAFGSFQRVIEVPCSINSSMAKASFHNGLLTITFPIISNRRLTRKRIPLG